MKFDLNLTITAIIALIALISPIITTIINNRYQLKLKKIELYEIAKRKCLEDFIKAISDCYSSSNSLGSVINFHSHISSLYVYFDNVPSSVEKLSTLSGKPLIEEMNKIVIELSKQLSKN